MADLQLLGSNFGLGKGVVVMSESRRALPAEDKEFFPRGIGGLIPVESIRKSGAAKIAYALPIGDPGTSWSIEDATFLKSGEDELPADFVPTSQVESTVDANLMDPEDVYYFLAEAVDTINDMLDEGYDVTGHPFGYVDSVRIGVPWRGSGYTRALYRPRGDDGPSPTPVRLVVETSIEPGSPNSLTAAVFYDRRGNISTLTITEFGYDSYWCRIEASVDYNTHQLSVYKVEERDGYHANGRLLYKRGQKNYKRDEYDRGW